MSSKKRKLCSSYINIYTYMLVKSFGSNSGCSNSSGGIK